MCFSCATQLITKYSMLLVCSSCTISQHYHCTWGFSWGKWSVLFCEDVSILNQRVCSVLKKLQLPQLNLQVLWRRGWLRSFTVKDCGDTVCISSRIYTIKCIQSRGVSSFTAAHLTDTVAFQSYYPLAKGLSNPTVTALVHKYGQTPAQICIRWRIRGGHWRKTEGCFCPEQSQITK